MDDNPEGQPQDLLGRYQETKAKVAEEKSQSVTFDPNQVGEEFTPGEEGYVSTTEQAQVQTGTGGGGAGTETKKMGWGFFSKFGRGPRGAVMDTTGGGGVKEGYHSESTTAQSRQVADEAEPRIKRGAV